MTLKKMRPQRKRKAIKHQEERFQATGPDQAWSIDFVADQLQDGRRFRATNSSGYLHSGGVAIEVGQSLKGDDVVQTLNRSKSKRGNCRNLLFCDNGSEFSSQAMDLWAYQNGVKIDFSRPGKPLTTRLSSRFNRTFRTECLDAYWFNDLNEAKRRSSRRLAAEEYNESRPHRSLRRKDTKRVRQSNRG